MDVAEKIKELAQAMMPSDQFVVDVIYTARKSPARLLVIVDGDQGVNIDQCAELSRQFSHQLDETNLIAGAYLLEVSTPGLDHPLKFTRQFIKNKGRELKVHLLDKRILRGRLTELSEAGIVLEAEVKEGKKKVIQRTELPFGQIEKAFVMVSFK